MKKTFKKMTAAVMAVTSLAVGIAKMNANASDSENEFDYAPAIGEFQYEEDWIKLIEEKERIANEYNNAIEMEDYDLASKIAKKSNLGFSQDIDSISSQPSFKRIAGIGQRAQEKDYWCGYAALESLLDYHYKNMTQSEIAKIVYSPDKSCPWYLSNGDSAEQFPVVTTLRKYTGFTYIPYPYGAAGSMTLTGSEISWRVKSTICNEHGLMACGTSSANVNSASHLPKYPAKTITHWLAIDGYSDSGNSIYILDPAKSSAVSWSSSISAMYTVSSDKLAAFASSRGLIW